MKSGTGLRMLICLGAALLFVSGCASRQTSGTGPEPGPALPQVSSFADDIKDIALPSELEWDRKKTMAIKTESFRGGIFYYVGRVDALSLKDYLTSSMQDNKWRLVGETASEDFMLTFVKPNKTCMMVISEGWLGRLTLTLYVAIDKAASGNVNPFGETVSP